MNGCLAEQVGSPVYPPAHGPVQTWPLLHQDEVIMRIKTIAASMLAGLFMLNIQASSAHAADLYEIDQIIDMNALTPEDVYRFVPNYLWIQPGDTIRFHNSMANHTVTSIKGMWPEGVERVNIAHQPSADVTFDRPGLYGFRCKVHGRHGMYALVIVGSPEPNLKDVEYTNVSKRGQKVFKILFEKLKEDMKTRGG